MDAGLNNPDASADMEAQYNLVMHHCLELWGALAQLLRMMHDVNGGAIILANIDAAPAPAHPAPCHAPARAPVGTGSAPSAPVLASPVGGGGAAPRHHHKLQVPVPVMANTVDDPVFYSIASSALVYHVLRDCCKLPSLTFAHRVGVIQRSTAVNRNFRPCTYCNHRRRVPLPRSPPRPVPKPSPDGDSSDADSSAGPAPRTPFKRALGADSAAAK